MEICQELEKYDKMEYVEIYLDGAIHLIESGYPRYPK